MPDLEHLLSLVAFRGQFAKYLKPPKAKQETEYQHETARKTMNDTTRYD